MLRAMSSKFCSCCMLKDRHVDHMMQIFGGFSKSPEDIVFLREDTGNPRDTEEKMPQPALMEKAINCCSTGAVVRGVPSACSQTEGGMVPAPLICLFMFLCGHEMPQDALTSFPTALTKSTDRLGPSWML